jgi:hypothetical protein
MTWPIRLPGRRKIRYARCAYCCDMASLERRRASSRPKVHYVLGDQKLSGDLVFQEKRPVLVVSWRTVEGRRVPYVSFPLEADKLRASGPNDYVYEGELRQD